MSFPRTEIKRQKVFMTAEQIAEKIQKLTGYYHQGFLSFGSVIGSLDPRTGQRTNDEPTVISVLVIEKLTWEVARAVWDRESFLDAESRTVFKNIDLNNPPSEEVVSDFVSIFFEAATGFPCSDEIKKNWTKIFNDLLQERSLEGAWQSVLGGMLQNGVFYYY